MNKRVNQQNATFVKLYGIFPYCRGMVALRRPPDLPVKKNVTWKEGFAQVAEGFARTLGLGQKEEQGYYTKHRYGVLRVNKLYMLDLFRRQYVKHVEVQRLVKASECEKVHALTVRCVFTTKIRVFHNCNFSTKRIVHTLTCLSGAYINQIQNSPPLGKV